ncbi:hypothetical protein ES703_63028 [subsurface metagenome]
MILYPGASFKASSIFLFVVWIVVVVRVSQVDSVVPTSRLFSQSFITIYYNMGGDGIK